MKAEELIDEDDWVEVEKATASNAPVADVSVRITLTAPGRFKSAPKARATVMFRGKAAEWIEANGPRFRVATGGARANFLRITPDIHKGKFEAHELPGRTGRSGIRRFNLGVIAAWPHEERAPTAAEWDVSAGWMKLKLPDDFAVASPAAPKPAAPPKLVAAAPVPQARSDPAPDVARGVPSSALKSFGDLAHLVNAPPARSPRTVSVAGDPEPGRSALDRRRS